MSRALVWIAEIAWTTGTKTVDAFCSDRQATGSHVESLTSYQHGVGLAFASLRCGYFIFPMRLFHDMSGDINHALGRGDYAEITTMTA